MKNLFCVFGLCALAGLAGCGSGKPATYPVSGKVTLDGKAVADATVTFVGTPPENSAATRTKADGTYSLGTFGEGDGAIPGSYKVIVTKITKGEEVSPYGQPPEDSAAPVEQTADAISKAYSQGYGGPPNAGGWKPPKVTNDIPAKYGDLDKSGLIFVVDSKPNTFDIVLTSK